MGDQPAPKQGRENVSPHVIEALEERAASSSLWHNDWPWLKERLLDRVEHGHRKYGTLLQTDNGRDAIADAWEESADLVMYLTQAHLEGEMVEPLLVRAEWILFSLTRIRIRKERG